MAGRSVETAIRCNSGKRHLQLIMLRKKMFIMMAGPLSIS